MEWAMETNMPITPAAYNAYVRVLDRWFEAGVTEQANDNEPPPERYVDLARWLKRLTKDEWAAMRTEDPAMYQLHRRNLKLIRNVEIANGMIIG